MEDCKKYLCGGRALHPDDFGKFGFGHGAKRHPDFRTRTGGIPAGDLF